MLEHNGKRAAKHLNRPGKSLVKKRQVLYAGDLARAASREAGWVAVVEGYTDVIAAHQVGLCNVDGTLGTALGDDHVTALRRVTEKGVLVCAGDAAGQNAPERPPELILGQEGDAPAQTPPDNPDTPPEIDRRASGREPRLHQPLPSPLVAGRRPVLGRRLYKRLRNLDQIFGVGVDPAVGGDVGAHAALASAMALISTLITPISAPTVVRAGLWPPRRLRYAAS